MKEDQPTPTEARRPSATKNSPAPIGPTVAELQAQVLALRALVEVLIERDSSIKTTITREGRSILKSVVDTSELPVSDKIMERAKRILLWTNSRKV